MAVVRNVAEFFLVSLAFGLALFSIMAKTRATGEGFVKLLSAIILACLTLGLILHLTYAPWLNPQSVLYLAVLGTTATVYFYHGEEKTPLMWLLYLLQNAFLLIHMYRFHAGAGEVFLYYLSSALLLGSISYAMILGHWYLVVPKLSETPLVKAVELSWVILVVKILISLYSLTQNFEFFSQGTQLGAGYSFNWVILTMRVGWGYLVVGVMSYFAWRLSKMRSIQSATGMLYAMTFFVLVGELTASYFYFRYGMYL